MTIITHTNNMHKVNRPQHGKLQKFHLYFQLILLSSVAALALAAPQGRPVGFGDATEQEIAEIRAGTYGETFDENPQYNFNFKVNPYRKKKSYG